MSAAPNERATGRHEFKDKAGSGRCLRIKYMYWLAFAATSVLGGGSRSCILEIWGAAMEGTQGGKEKRNAEQSRADTEQSTADREGWAEQSIEGTAEQRRKSK